MKICIKLFILVLICSMPSIGFAASKKINKETTSRISSKLSTKKINNKTSKPQLSAALNIQKIAFDDFALSSVFKNDVRKDEQFLKALDLSIEYFETMQDKGFVYSYGDEKYTPKEMLQSMMMFKELASQDGSYEEFLSELNGKFDFYSINNYQSRSIFTGYFTPKLKASLVKDSEYFVPLHLRDGSAIFLSSQSAAKTALMEGAGILTLNNGETKVVNYDTTKYEHQTISVKMAKKIKRKMVVFYAQKNISVPKPVFFEADEPRGCIAAPLTPGYSAAMDSRYTPMGSLIYVYNQTNINEEPFERFMLVQDSGGAIKGPGRIDIYMGEGDQAKTNTYTLSRNGSVLMLVAKKDILSTSIVANAIISNDKREY